MSKLEDVSAVAIRFDPIEKGPEHLRGSQPIVIHTEQGTTGAGKKQAALVGPPQEVDAQDTLLPPGSFKDEVRGQLLAPHNIKNIIFAIDISSSMTNAAFPRGESAESKLEYVKRVMERFAKSALPDANYHIVLYDRNAQHMEVTHGEDDLKQSLLKELQHLKTGRGTNISNGLRGVLEILNKEDVQPTDRNLVVLFTDGYDESSSRKTAWQLTQQVAKKNTAVQLCGVGPSYDEYNIFDLASHAGYAGWEHLPGQHAREDVIELLLRPMIQDLQNSEHYLKLDLKGDYKDPLAITPSVRAVQDNQVTIGYQRESFNILFQTGKSVEVKLLAGDNVQNATTPVQDVPIIDIKDAAAHFEIAELCRNVITPALYHLSLYQHDPRAALGSLLGQDPRLDGIIEQFLGTKGAQDLVSKNQEKESMALSGGTLGMADTITDRKGQAKTLAGLSELSGPSKQELGLHSGNLGRLDQPPAESIIAPANNPDPAAYGKRPQYAYSAVFSELTRSPRGEIIMASEDWGKYFDDFGELVIGRSSDAGMQISAAAVSRLHCKLKMREGVLYISDVGSRNGTLVNDQRISSEVILNKGDTFTICDLNFRYHGPSTH